MAYQVIIAGRMFTTVRVSSDGLISAAVAIVIFTVYQATAAIL